VPQSKRHPARRPQRRQPKAGHGNPAAAAAAKAAPPTASGWRASLERWSVGPLTFMSSLPTWLVPTLLAVLLVAGLAVNARWAGLLLLVPTAFLAWLSLLSWPATTPVGRIARISAVTLLASAALLKLLGKW
jgi:hypothetical protein